MLIIPQSTDISTVMRLLLCLLTLCAISAHAQFDVSMKLPRPNFMALEAIQATVTITNRTGAEAVLGGPGRAEWLSFEMTTSEGQQLATMDVSGAELVQLPPGGTIQRKVTVTDAYAPSEIGNYAITARVLHSPSGSTYTLSNLMIWNNTIAGIAFGGGNSGTMRFLTIYGNGTQTGTATPGIDCGASPLLVEHSIVFDNLIRESSGSISLDQQLTGCMLSNVVTNDKVAAGTIYKTAIEFVQPAGDTANIDLHLIKDSPKNRDCCVD